MFGPKKFVIIHYDKDCKRLNADYTSEKSKLIVTNSGVSNFDFESDKELKEFFTKYDCKYQLCGNCESKEDLELYECFLLYIEEQNSIPPTIFEKLNPYDFI